MHRMDDNMPFLLRYENVAWYDSDKVRILDRRAFPEVHFVECSTYREVRQAVADMVTQSTGPYAAVAMGMVLEARGCAGLGLTSAHTANEIHDLIQSFGFAVDPPCTVQDILPYLVHDKRIRNNTIGLIVAETPGSCHMEPYPAVQLEEFAKLGFGEQ
mgnify:CR=1 FL=1